MPYRADVDGLRAIAIGIVVAYHVGVPGFPGGFVGVDVFFVISGFLITTLLMRELLTTGTINFPEFYARRARRLLPAFFLVICATPVLGAILLLPIENELKHLAKSAIFASIYISNVFFAQTTGGYFDVSSDYLPLIHTWSLAVEEQFYFIWPILLLAAAWIAHRARLKVMPVVVTLLTLIFFASLSYSQISLEAGGKDARAAFFVLPARAWELAIGAAVALWAPRLKLLPVSLGAALSLLGLVAIALSVAMLSAGKLFPGVAALLPTVGAAVLIVGGSLSPKSFVTRALSSRPLVGIGLLSYSWYLWHWPLLSMFRSLDGGVQVWRDCALALLALGLAWLTYIWVERPIRTRTLFGNWRPWRVALVSGAGALLIIVSAQALNAYSDYLEQSSTYKRLAQAANDKTWGGSRCHDDNGLCPRDPGTKYRGTVVLWGDSHADQFAPMVHAAVAPLGLDLLSRDKGGCPPVSNVVVYSGADLLEACTTFNDGALSDIKRLSERGELVGVVLSARWPLYLNERKPSGIPSSLLIALPEQPPSQNVAPDSLRVGLESTIKALVARGLKIVVIAPAPEQRFDIPKCLARRSLDACSISRSQGELYRHTAMTAIGAAIDHSKSVRLWDPFVALCDSVRCPAEQHGVPLYHDDGHLTFTASLDLAKGFSQPAAWLANANSLQ